MTAAQSIAKRGFDVVLAASGLLVLWPVILVTWIMAARDTGASGFFRQERVGRGGRVFRVVKLRTMYPAGGTTVTTAKDQRITPMGARFRRWKLDELPQLWNVLVGDMSLVGPRPDVPGFFATVIWPDKVRINRAYLRDWSLTGDVRYILKTVFR